MSYRKAMSPKRKASSPARSGGESVKTSPNTLKSMMDTTVVEKYLNTKAVDFFIRWGLIIAILAIFVTCLVLFLTGHNNVKDALNTHFDFTSSFLYETWLVIPVLVLVALGLMYIVYRVKYFTIPVVILMILILVFFTLMFVMIYHTTPSKSSTAPQIISFVLLACSIIFMLLLVNNTRNILGSVLASVPLFFLTGVGIYLGGVMNGEYA